jgi:GrpB-like predicted nucleotidyltransferase (UPF0157 family)
MSGPIIIVEYDPSRPEVFQLLRKWITDELGSIAAAVEHVGSTFFSSLPAKPIVDIDVLFSDDRALSIVI